MKFFYLKYLIFALFAFDSNYLLGQKTFYGKDAQKIIQGAEIVYYSKNNDNFPSFIKFNKPLTTEQLLSLWNYKSHIKAVLTKTETDELGINHHYYQQYIDSIPIEWAVFKLHCKNNQVLSFSGTVWNNLESLKNINITKEQAIQIALSHHPAELYMWEDEQEELYYKTITNNPNATFYPSPKLIYYKTNNEFALSYKLTIYSKIPLAKKDYYIDANTGKVIRELNKIYTYDVPGTAVTRYSGTQPITADYHNGSYRLRESGRGNGIYTLNMLMGTNYYNAIDFIDNDNYWNNFNIYQDEVATDAHWATEKYYDYFYANFNRNSIDNNGFALYNYIHADLVGMGFPNNVNAFWDGLRVTYGDGNANFSPLTTVDIVAHELTHGLTEFTANLIYADESGALNEGFSDIFATVVEFYAKPLHANWTIGEDIGITFRSLANPNLFNDPDTYMGNYWDYNNQVHQNSTVFSHWFYLVSNGGTGTNDFGHQFSVNGIGIAKAAKIAYRMLVYYLPSNATYSDARFFAIIAATDLFGSCSYEVETVTNAMYAVGVGPPYQNQVVANFSAALTQTCAPPLGVQFINQSSNGQSFYWDFGDGTYSTEINPYHVYSDSGTFSVTLIVNGGSCGQDTLTLHNLISISSSNPCIVIMPLNGIGNTITACQGVLYDGGGPTGNYADMSDAIITISPTNANKIRLTFTTFDIEPGSGSFCDFDYVEIFDGPSINSPSLGRFCNTTGSPGTIESSGGSLTILLHSDQYVTNAGFSANWVCEMLHVAPSANFYIQPINTCSGLISFVDMSLHNPTSWFWDFGDGNTSTLQNPVHEYLYSGIFDVTLIVSNSNGSDTIVMNNAVIINRPEAPFIANDTICENEQSILFSQNNNGTLLWYYNETDSIPFYIGDTLITPPLSQPTTYWVQNAHINPAQYVGDTRSSIEGAFFNNSTKHYLIFDCFTECKLVSVEVNAKTSANRLIELKDSLGNTLQSKNVYIPAGISRILLDFNLPIQNNLRLVGPGFPNLWRNNVNIAYYPYTIANVISIKSSSALTNPTGYYYYFYNWEVKLPDCFSAKVPVTVITENCTYEATNPNIFLTIYPNPAKDYIYIKTNNHIQALTILDISGKNIPVTITKSENKFKINISHFNPGLYFAYLQLENMIYIKKLFVY